MEKWKEYKRSDNSVESLKIKARALSLPFMYHIEYCNSLFKDLAAAVLTSETGEIEKSILEITVYNLKRVEDFILPIFGSDKRKIFMEELTEIVSERLWSKTIIDIEDEEFDAYFKQFCADALSDYRECTELGEDVSLFFNKIRKCVLTKIDNNSIYMFTGLMAKSLGELNLIGLFIPNYTERELGELIDKRIKMKKK